ncbi:hypothetical protein PRNP1_005157 [Phytophthora ramorum]
MRLNYVLAVLVVFQCCGVQAYSDIPSLLTGLSTLAPPMVPLSLNMALRSLVKDVATFVKYPANLQRAMLWNAGWVRIIPESAGSGSASNGVGEYVQCGLTMSSIFLSESTLSDGSLCELKTCKEGIITYTRSTCERSYVESKTLCALSPEADSFDATLSQRNGPMWSTNGDLDESFDPQFYQFNNGTGDNPSIYMLAQQSSWIMSDDSCSNRAQFIVPCRKVGDDEIADTWCVPPIESWVLDWVDNETQSIDPSAVTTIQDSTEGNGGLSTPAIVGIIVACIVVILILLGFIVVRQRRSRANHGQTGLWDDDIITANRVPREKQKRARSDASPVEKMTPSPRDAEMELLRALEEEIAKEEERNKSKTKRQEEEDDDYDESDDE